MEKSKLVSIIISGICLFVLIINTLIINVIRIEVDPNPTLLDKALGYLKKEKAPQEIKILQPFGQPDYAELTILDNGVTSKISAPVQIVEEHYDYWTGRSYNTYRTNTYSVNNEDNRIVYVSANFKNLYKKLESIDNIVNAKIYYDNKYEFDCNSISLNKEKDDFHNFVPSLMPLKSVEFYWVATLPKEFAYSQKPFTLELLMNDQKYVMRLKK